MIKSEEVMAEEYIEVSEKTLDDAITAACRRLSVTSDKLTSLNMLLLIREAADSLGSMPEKP